MTALSAQSSVPQRRMQTKTAESWLTRQERAREPTARDVQREAGAQDVRLAMEDESAAWLRRSSAVRSPP